MNLILPLLRMFYERNARATAVARNGTHTAPDTFHVKSMSQHRTSAQTQPLPLLLPCKKPSGIHTIAVIGLIHGSRHVGFNIIMQINHVISEGASNSNLGDF